MKYGIMYYKDTDNIGDDIQAYAAKRFLPQIDYYIDREDLNCFVPKNKEYVSVIMNGWFLHNKAAWPPSPYINPLLMSMHFTCLEKIDVGEKYLIGLGGDYLKKHEPIGARDIETKNRLTRNGIESYFSGCMTLTIPPFENVKKKEYICIVDVDEDSRKLIKENTTREIKELTHNVNSEEINKKDFETRMKDVENLLKIYQGAKIVFTNRLHVALPCIALETPVVLIHKENFEEDRLGTYLDYVISYSDKEFKEIDIKILIDNPPKNNQKHLEIRNSLIEKCKQFVKKCETEKLNEDNLPDVEEYKKYTKKLKWYVNMYAELKKRMISNVGESEEIWKELKTKEKENNEMKIQNQELKERYTRLEQELKQVYNSKGWKLLEKIRKIKRR